MANIPLGLLHNRFNFSYRVESIIYPSLTFAKDLYVKYTFDKKQFVVGAALAGRCALFFSTALNPALVIVATSVTALFYFTLATTIRILWNYKTHKKEFLEYLPYHDTLWTGILKDISISSVAPKLEERAKALERCFLENMKTIFQKEPLFAFYKLIDNYNLACMQEDKVNPETDFTTFSDDDHRVFITKLFFWLLERYKLELYTIKTSLFDTFYTIYLERGGLLSKELSKDRFMKKCDEIGLQTTFKDQLKLYQSGLLKILEKSTFLPPYGPANFQLPVNLDLDSFHIDPSQTILKLLDYFDLFSTDDDDSIFYVDIQDYKLDDLVFPKHIGRSKLREKLDDILTYRQANQVSVPSDPDQARAFYDQQKKQLLILISYIERKKKDLKAKYKLEKLPTSKKALEAPQLVALKKELLDLLDDQKSFTIKIAGASIFCHTRVKEELEQLFNINVDKMLDSTQATRGALNEFLQTQLAFYRKDCLEQLIQEEIARYPDQSQSVHLAASCKSFITLFFPIPFIEYSIESLSKLTFVTKRYYLSKFLQKYNLDTLAKHLTEMFKKNDQFKDLITAQADDSATDFMREDYTGAIALLERSFMNLNITHEKSETDSTRDSMLKTFISSIEKNSILKESLTFDSNGQTTLLKPLQLEQKYLTELIELVRNDQKHRNKRALLLGDDDEYDNEKIKEFLKKTLIRLKIFNLVPGVPDT